MNEFDCANEKMLKITEYKLLGELPNPFVFENGEPVADPSQWENRRRELYKTAVELQYGTLPPEPEFLECETLYVSPTHCSFHIKTGTLKRPVTFRMQVILPPDISGKVPVIVDGDQCWRYHMDRDFIRAATDRGIGWVFFDRTELAHDISSEGRGKGVLYQTYPEYSFGAIGAWAWGYSRCVDALERLDLPIDLDWIAFSGHSRGGKTAALAGAVDTRARIVNANDTCAGAHGCYRIHMKGVYIDDGTEKRSETLRDLWNNFSFWIGEGMEKYADKEQELPFDAHYLKALVAPRTLFVSEAAGDLWANPAGSWQTTMAAKKVFEFLGAENNLFWYFRPGFHCHSVADVQMLVNVIEHQRNGAPLDGRMFRKPFGDLPPAFGWDAPDYSKR